MGLLPDPAHDQDVVVGSQGHQEHEHQEGQDEIETILATELDEHEGCDAERRKIREDDARHEVERRNQAAQDEGQQERDEDRDDRDDPGQVPA